MRSLRQLHVGLALVVAIVFGGLPGATTTRADASVRGYDDRATSRVDAQQAIDVEGYGDNARARLTATIGDQRPSPHRDAPRSGSLGVATNSLATGTDEAVFWSGIRGGDSAAASWAAKNGGASLESTLAQRGISLPAWDASNPSVVSAWRTASADFAAGARGTVRVLQDDAVRVNSVRAEVEFPALKANPNVTSIRGVDPRTGGETVLWGR